MKEVLTLTRDEACEILDGDNDKFEVIQDKIISKNRWSIINKLIIKRVSDGKFFCDRYSVGATESQDESPWEHNEPQFTEVFPVEKKVIVYE